MMATYRKRKTSFYKLNSGKNLKLSEKDFILLVKILNKEPQLQKLQLRLIDNIFFLKIAGQGLHKTGFHLRTAKKSLLLNNNAKNV